MSTTNEDTVIRIQVKPGVIQNNVNNGIQLYNNNTGRVISAFGAEHSNAETDIVSGGTITFFAVNFNRNSDPYKDIKVYTIGIERKHGSQDLVGLPERVNETIHGASPNYLVCDVLTGIADGTVESYTITIELKSGDQILGVYDIDPKMKMRGKGSGR